MFKQAKQNRAFEDVIFQIQEAILQRSLKVGDKLPSERQLREIFKVSRGTLREALRALEQKGLITIKIGVQGGAIVCPVDTRQMSESLDFLLRYQKVSLKELGEFRELVEPLVAAKAVQKAKKDDIRQLTSIVDSIKNNLNAREPKWDELITEDTKFHLSLAQIARNKVFESVLYTIYDNINRYFERFLPRDVRILEGIYQDFGKIVKAAEKRNSNEAKNIIYRHVRRFNIMMEKGEKKQQ